MKRIVVTALAVLGFGLFFGITPGANPAWAKGASALKTLDTDNDGTVDLNEAKAAASTEFDKLDKDHDGTLDKKELGKHLAGKNFTAADGDKDGTVSKDEYAAVVEQRFKAADRDNEGTVDAKELSSGHGKALVKLLK
jgi:Ca2+-binding EF-hand superfamily protein